MPGLFTIRFSVCNGELMTAHLTWSNEGSAQVFEIATPYHKFIRKLKPGKARGKETCRINDNITVSWSGENFVVNYPGANFSTTKTPELVESFFTCIAKWQETIPKYTHVAYH